MHEIVMAYSGSLSSYISHTGFSGWLMLDTSQRHELSLPFSAFSISRLYFILMPTLPPQKGIEIILL